MDNTLVLSISGVALSVTGIIYTAVNHKRIRSKCCGRVLEASIDVETTTPPLTIKSTDR